MSQEENKVLSHHEEDCIIVQVPDGSQKAAIEREIHEALSEFPDDIFAQHPSGDLVIVVQSESDRPRHGPPPTPPPTAD